MARFRPTSAASAARRTPVRPRPALTGVTAAALLGAFAPSAPLAAEAGGPATVTNAPTAVTYAIERYEISGGPALEPDLVRRLTAPATGPAVPLAEIRRTLRSLQQAYREHGHRQVALQLPSQPLTDGVVRLRATDGAVPSPTAPTLPAWTAPTYDIRHFEVRGNSVLAVEELDRLLSPAAGPAVDLGQLQQVVTRLQTAYRERGYSGAAVKLPQQLLTGGTVIVAVDEGLSPAARLSRQRIDPNPTPTNRPPAVPTFEVRRYDVAGNTLLRPEFVEQVFTNATGAAVSLPQIQKALGQLQLAYRERGFATVSVGLPPQQLTNAVVKVQVTEGVLAEIQVSGNRHFSSNNVVRALPSLRTNALFNSLVFQRELDLANQNRDRTIYPVVGPGPDPGTSALTLRVKDRLPLHGRLEVNNQATPGTPEWRVNSSAQFNNLWQREHQVGVSYGFSPEEFKGDGPWPDYFFNRPLIANYGAYYRLPFGNPDSVEQQIAGSTRFGFDEATRQFRLPPAGSRPDLSFFVSAASSDTGVQQGPISVVSQTPLLTILSRDSGQNLMVNESAGARVNVPLALTDTNRWGFSGGADWKRFFLQSFNTNNFLTVTVVTNAQGSQSIANLVSSPQPARSTEVQYLPLVTSADYSQSDRWGTFAANLSLGGNFVGERSNFAAAAHSTNATATYGKATLALTRDQRIFQDWSLLLRASGQIATGALIANEQFSLGGLNSVRGYFEGDVFGDAGWFSSAELRTPFINAPVPIGVGSVPVWLRGSVFMDYGQSFLLEAPAGRTDSVSLWGAGFGVSANVNNHLDVRVSLGWPLLDSPNRRAGDPRAYFSVGGQF
jgi:hemolysin activation/secretion protein